MTPLGPSSWTNAYTDLQSALASAYSGDEVWVAAGVYKPTSGTDRTKAFFLPVGVALYGGFAGTETSRDQRDWETNLATLSGEIGDPSATTDNSYHVVYCAGHIYWPDPAAVLDGFIVTAGRADVGSYIVASASGGGMYNDRSSPKVENVVFIGNYAMFGGGMANSDRSSPALADVTFTGNNAHLGGGGLYNYNLSSPTLTDVVFTGNETLSDAGSGGAGMGNFYLCSPTLTRVSFTNNAVPGNISGGGLCAENQCSLTLSDVVFTGNSAGGGGAMRLHDHVQAELQRVTFTENTSSWNGGALYVSNSSSVNIFGTVFEANTSTGSDGGAMYLEWGSATITNTVFSNNTVAASPDWESHGGAVSSMGASSLAFTNVSFSGNEAGGSGGALYNFNTDPSLLNCILWDNWAPGAGSQIDDGYLASSSVSYSIIQGGWTELGSDNLDEYPLFVDAASGDLRLNAGSPAIDSGTSAGAPDTDLDGTVRPQGDGYDMGAFEGVANTWPTDITLSNWSVAENEPTGTGVGVLAPVDPDDPDSHSFALAPGAGDTDNASFNISGSELQTAESFDYETKSSYSIRVEVTDRGGLTYQKQFTITVTDVNDAPVISSNGGGSAARVSVDEGETEVTDVQATDRDGDALTYQIAGGDDASFFTINAVTGLLSFIEAPSYRHPLDADANNVYEVVVQVVDDGSPALTDTQSMDVRVRNVQYFLLRYRAGEGGSISGRSAQPVRSGQDGTEVVAVPDTGYRFLQWSDGLSTAARTDTDVRASVSVRAEFELIPMPPPHVDRWTDITDAEWVSSYGVTADQMWTVAQGFPDRTYRPTLAVTRGQFAKMVVDGFGLGMFTPPEPTFLDVRATHALFDWIEGAAKASVVRGYADGYFHPQRNISREHVNTILGRYLSVQELMAEGHIRGDLSEYGSVEDWFASEGADVLASFADAGSVSPDHRVFTAYLVYRGVVKGTAQAGGTYLLPLFGVTRAQAAVLVLRVAGEL